jgi:hypothetical protein
MKQVEPMPPLVLVVILGVLLASGAASAQVCSAVGSTVTCSHPNGQTTIQQQLNPNTGVVIQPDGSLTPYTILSPNAPGSAPTATIVLPSPVAPVPPVPPVIVLPTPSVSGY